MKKSSSASAHGHDTLIVGIISCLGFFVFVIWIAYQLISQEWISHPALKMLAVVAELAVGFVVFISLVGLLSEYYCLRDKQLCGRLWDRITLKRIWRELFPSVHYPYHINHTP